MPSWKKIIVSGSKAVLNEVTASNGFQGDGSKITNLSYDNISSKPTLVSGSSQISNEISGAFGETSSSLAGRIATNKNFLNQGVTTTDSPTFAGLTTTGDVVVQGKLTAEVYAVSSSVTLMTQSFSSGSTIFGDDSNDTHQFTGSVSISGSLNLNGETFTTAVSSSAAASGFSSAASFTAAGISGSFSEASGGFSTRLATEESNVDNLQTDSGSFSTRISTLEGTGTTQGVGQGDNVTFDRINTTGPDTFGGNVTIAGNLTLQGSQSAAETLVIADQFGFFASGSESSPVDAGLLVQSGSSPMTGSALYNDVNVDSNTNPKGGRWSVAKGVKADDTAVTPSAFVSTVTVGGDTTEPDDDSVQYGVGEMYITSDGEIFIYTGS